MKAVNQSIGRAVRHKDDYATVLLLDHRYSRTHIQSALPNWMKSSLLTCEKFGPAFSAVTKVRFFVYYLIKFLCIDLFTIVFLLSSFSKRRRTNRDETKC